MSQPKVVELNATSKKKTSSLPPVVHTLRQHSRKQLAELFERLFNNVDDALFEMADRSRSDADQHLYFESMRELRLQREAIRKAFTRTYSNGFDVAFTPAEHVEQASGPDFEHVSILDNDELEVSVAVTGIISKVTSQYSLQIMQLTKRFDHLAKNTEITERLNPMGPECISQSFVTALECADLDIKVRIILLKLFERFVMERLSGFYTDGNQMLADAGVLTDLKNVMRRDRQSPPREPRSRRDEGGFHATTSYAGGDTAGTGSYARGGGGGGGGGAAGGHAEVGGGGGGSGDSTGYGGGGHAGGGSNGGFSVIQELLAAHRGNDDHGTAGSPTGNALSTADVLTALYDAQAELTAPIDIESVPSVIDLRHLVINSARAADAGHARLDQADDDVVHFVGMLFDYILNDRNLAIPMKALIGRLQLPIVRLAIMDRSFFDHSNHPARQLLNELSSAGIGWSSAKELKRDAMYNKIESVVLRVMNGFSEDVAIFEELLDELRRFVKGDRAKREQVEQRVRDNEKGRARTINAKQAAQKLINQKASGMRLPPEAGRFISDTWSKVLVYTCVKEGERSPAWHAQAEILDRLLWCLQPLDNVDDLNRRDEMIPEVIHDLRAGMSQIQLQDAEVDKRIEELERHLASISANDRAYLDEDEPAPMDESYAIMDEIVLTLPGEQLDTKADVDIEPEFMEQIGKLRVGSWVELAHSSGELLRCKLSTIVEPGGRYIFVNRRGMKVAERSRRGLAVELKRKTLTILEESQVFDRALQAVIGNLRQMHRAATPTA
ncbi:MAG: DUF1631 domain-containing protein [Pseudomonadales bacterium]